MSDDNRATAAALLEIAHVLRLLGFGDACMQGQGALEAHGMHMGERVERVANSLESIANALREVAGAIRDHGSAADA